MAPLGDRPLRALRRSRETWETLANQDPLWAIASDDAKRGGGWDLEEFFGTGRAHIGDLMGHLEAIGASPKRIAALDFGCGVGRLTRPLVEHFDEVVGIDVAEAMIEQARQINRAVRQCRFIHNPCTDLRQFADASFDMVHTHIVLQHIPPPTAAQYIGELVRVTKPDGVIVLQMPTGPHPRALTLREQIGRRVPGALLAELRRLARRAPVFEMHGLPREVVERTISDAGGRVVEVVEDGAAGPRWHSLRYIARREEASLAAAGDASSA